jgi:hypothetical protein
MNFGHKSVTVDILFKYGMSKYELFVFLWFFNWCFMGSNNSGKHVSFQKQLWQAHASALAANIKKIIVACLPGPNCQQMWCGFTSHRREWHWPTRQRQRQQANVRRQWLQDLIHQDAEPSGASAPTHYSITASTCHSIAHRAPSRARSHASPLS